MNAPAEPAPHINRGMITATVMLTSILQTLDNTIANVALPHMQGSLSATQEQMIWVLTSYIVATAIMTPATAGSRAASDASVCSSSRWPVSH
jgi:DHA2 family multidrug resistance protein